MSFFCRLSRKHYWCIPHRSADNRLIQVCYECGAERPARELHDEIAKEQFSHSQVSAKADVVNLSAHRPSKLASWRATRREEIAVGQNGVRKLSLVK